MWNIQQVKQFLPFVTMQQRLLHASVNERFRGHHRWLLFCIAVLTDTHNTDYRNCLMNFVRCSNVLRNYMVVSSVGLGQFVEYFTSGVRRADKKYFESEGMKYDFLEGFVENIVYPLITFLVKISLIFTIIKSWTSMLGMKKKTFSKNRI